MARDEGPTNDVENGPSGKRGPGKGRGDKAPGRKMPGGRTPPRGGPGEDQPPDRPPRIPPEIVPAGYPLLAFVSDFHMGADPYVDDFDEADEVAFDEMIDVLVQFGSGLDKEIELVLLGDFLEFWETRPFFPRETGEERVAELTRRKIDKIVERHPSVFAGLRRLQRERPGTRIHYVAGNHDDDIRRDDVQNHLRRVTDVRFEHRVLYLEEDFELYAEHGNRYDDDNDFGTYGEKIRGRRVTESLVVELEAFGVRYGAGDLTIAPRLEYPFGAIDEIDRFGDYVACLRRRGIITNAQVERLRERLEEIRDEIVGVTPDLFAFLVDLLRSSPTPEERIQALLDTADWFRDDGPTLDDAREIFGAGDYQCVLMGHTHKKMFVELPGNRLYVNTGAWQDIGTFDPDAGTCFRRDANRHLTLIYRVADPDDDPARKSREVRVEMFTFPGLQSIAKGAYVMRHPH